MTDHGLDIEAIQEASGGHSIFSPSGSAMWTGCAGSLIPNIFAEDTAGEDAAYGTVGHEVGEQWLLNYIVAKAKFGGPDDMLVDMSEPRDLVGTVRTINEKAQSFDIEIDDEMIAYVRRYVEWCISDEGDFYVEQRVDFSHLTPIDKQTGTADWAACRWQLLKVKDLKMGRSPDNKVYAKDNTQALLYAIGFFREWDWLYDFQEVHIGIAQPRLDHFDEWIITREELLSWEHWFEQKAAEAWVPDAPRTPSVKACKWCKVKGTCAALAHWLETAVDGAFEDLDDDGLEDCPRCDGSGFDGFGTGYDNVCDHCGGQQRMPRDTIDLAPDQYREVTKSEMISVKERIVAGWKPNPRDPTTLSTEELEKLLPFRKLVEKWFSDISDELQSRAVNGEELTKHKLVDGRLGRRAWHNENKAKAKLVRLGVAESDTVETKTVSPARAEELLRKEGYTRAQAKKLLAPAVFQAQGRQTLAPIKDEREALQSPADAFDDLDADL